MFRSRLSELHRAFQQTAIHPAENQNGDIHQQMCKLTQSFDAIDSRHHQIQHDSLRGG
jgi:hypothetical protein